MQQVQKWGFGMAPLKPETDYKNREALTITRDFVLGQGTFNPENLVNALSRTKGIFNRIIKQDQWDWFTVNMYLDYPPYHNIRNIVSELALLRNAILKKNDKLGQVAIKQLGENHFVTYINNYLNFDLNADSEAEYLYILSRREEKDILKIGRTTRNIQKRVNEINSATGVIYPLSARHVFKVKNSKLVEKEIHNLLSDYRIRKDREFFKIEYSKACEIIDGYLQQNHLYFYD